VVSRSDDESLITDLIEAFSIAVERAVPRDLAALMCADEAESFLDNISDPESEGVVPVREQAVHVLAVRVFDDLALARFTRSTEEVRTLYFRREDGRWTVCADAEDELSRHGSRDGRSLAEHGAPHDEISNLISEFLVDR
jgi:hypothetical protein